MCAKTKQKSTKTSLKLKLAIAFVLVALVTGAVLALVFKRFNNQQFADFVIESQRIELLMSLNDHYLKYGTWEGAEIYFANLPRGQGLGQGQGLGFRHGGQGQHAGQRTNETSNENDITVPGRLFGLATTDGTVLISIPGGTPVGGALNTAVIQSSDPIIVEDEVVGYLLTVDQFPGYSEAENHFIQRSNRALWLALLGATLIAAAIGLLIASGITRPLETLTRASQRIANRELNTKVPELGRDEIGILGKNFNQMSARLEESDNLRKRMTADIAHDLRTPLTVINGYVESMRDGDLPVTTKRLELISDETSRLSKMIDDLRLLSIADAGELPLQKQLVNPKGFLEYSFNLFNIQASRRNITLTLEPVEIQSQVLIDEDRMIQVFSNLINNALEYCPEGSTITLRATENDQQVTFAISDNGPGIPTEELPYIFERFHRLDSSRHNSEQHSGLGLAIAKAIINAHGGHIHAISEPGQGTTMILTLPAAQA